MGIQIDGQTGQIRALGGNVNLDGEVTATVLNQNVSGVTTFTDAQFTNGFSVTGVVTSTTIGTDEIHLGSSQPNSNPVIIRQITSGKKAGTVKFAKTHRDAQGRSVEVEDEEVSVGIGTTVSINTTGIVTASSFHGDGSNLSGLPQSGIGINTAGGNLGYGVTSITFDGSGVASVSLDTNTGTATVNISGGGGGGGGGGGSSTTSAKIATSSQSVVPTGHEASTSTYFHAVDDVQKPTKFHYIFVTRYDPNGGSDYRPYINSCIVDINASNGAVTFGSVATLDLVDQSTWGNGNFCPQLPSMYFMINWRNGGAIQTYIYATVGSTTHEGWFSTYTINTSNNTVTWTAQGMGGYTSARGAQSHNGNVYLRSSGNTSWILSERRYVGTSGSTRGKYKRKITVSADGQTITTSSSQISGADPSYTSDCVGFWEDPDNPPSGSEISSFTYSYTGTSSPNTTALIYTCTFDGTEAGPFTVNAHTTSAYYYFPQYALYYTNTSPRVGFAYQTYSGGQYSYAQQQGSPPWIDFTNPASPSVTTYTSYTIMPPNYPHTFTFLRASTSAIAIQVPQNTLLSLSSGNQMIIVNGFHQTYFQYLFAYNNKWVKTNSTGTAALAVYEPHLDDLMEVLNERQTFIGMYRIYASNTDTDPSAFAIVDYTSTGQLRIGTFNWPSEFT